MLARGLKVLGFGCWILINLMYICGNTMGKANMNQAALYSHSTQSSGIRPEDVLFVINANSGKKQPEKIAAKLQSYHRQIPYKITQTKEEAEATFTQLAPKYKAIVIVGGDGTVNMALPYLVNLPDLVLAVWPNGSGNGFARELGFDKNLEGLMRAFRQGETLDLDVLSINNELSVNVSGIGIDSYVAYHFQKSQRRGLVSYLLSTAKAILQFRDFEARIHALGHEYSGKYRMIAIANTRQFGNNAIIAPHARPYGGRYELVLVKPFPFWKYPEFILKMFTGKLSSSKYIQYLTVKGSTRIFWENDKYHLDGEPKSSVDDLIVDIMPGQIRVFKR